MSDEYLYKTMVWSVVVYEAESWAILKAGRKTIETFGTRCWREMLKIHRTERVSIEYVHNKIK